jgi:4-diphosphocytidyl-2-C-methyl-D-erythritol kinase
VSVAPAEVLSLAIDGPFGEALAAEPDNLVLRAARALAAAAEARGWSRRCTGAAIRLTKRLPPASGIGGGSSDAAATLLALAQVWRLPADPELLASVGLALGADVPVCLARAPRFVGGIGERLDPVPPLPPVHLLLVNPGVPVATAAVFKSRAPLLSEPARWSDAVADVAELARRLAGRSNDLAEAAARIAPVIGDVLGALEAQPGCLLARLSGSGATCFGLFADVEDAGAGASAIAAAQPRWWVQPAPLLRAAAEADTIA